MDNEQAGLEAENQEIGSDTEINTEQQGRELAENAPESKNYQKMWLDQKGRAYKAEQELKTLKAKLSEKKETETPKNEESKQSNEPDYSKIAFLEGRKVSHPDDQKLVMDEAARLKLPLTDILGMEHVKAKLKNMNDQREAQDGAPKGSGKAGGTTKQDVDYWLAKGGTPDDLELANKVIDARMKQERSRGMFSDELFVG